MTSNCAIIARRLREDAAGSERLPAADFIALLDDTFRHAGLSAADAAIAAEVAAYGTLHGSDAHGAVQLPLYVTGLLDGTIKSAPNIAIQRQSALLRGDGRRQRARSGRRPARHRRRHRPRARSSVSVRLRCATVVISAGRATMPNGGAPGTDRLRLHQRLAGDCADRVEGGAARHQSDRRRFPAARAGADRGRHGDQRGGALAHPLHAGARTKDACPKDGRSIRTASRRPIRRWR